jgi:dTDP-4-amino-4,6-dideoxygalactose transaminase
MTQGKGIPFVDLIAPHRELHTELMAAAESVLTSAMFIGGPIVEQFEREFAKFCDVDHCARCEPAEPMRCGLHSWRREW